MMLTLLFAATSVVGAVVLVVEIRTIIKRRRAEREWRNGDGRPHP